MRRGYIHDAALAVADSYRINSQDVLLHVLPVHHALGIGLMFFAFLYAGALIEFRSGGFDPEWMWERWRRGGLTFFAGVSTIYMRMKRYFEQKLAKLAPEAKYDYVQGVRNFKVLFCGAGALPHPIAAFWTDMRGGKRVLQRYGATEFGAVITIRLNDENTPDGSVGQVTPGVELKLSGGGDEGEILIKSSQMFSRYVRSSQQILDLKPLSERTDQIGISTIKSQQQMHMTRMGSSRLATLHVGKGSTTSSSAAPLSTSSSLVATRSLPLKSSAKCLHCHISKRSWSLVSRTRNMVNA